MILGAGGLVAVAPVAVGAGLFVPGFAALGLGAILLLLPPGIRLGHGRRLPLRVLGAPLSAGRRAIPAAAGATGVCARAAAGVASRTWSAVSGAARLVSRGLASAGRELATDVRAAASTTWARSRPWLGRAWAAGVAGFARGGRELDALARAASERLSAALDPNRPFARSAPEPPRRGPQRVRGPRQPISRRPGPRHRRGSRGGR